MTITWASPKLDTHPIVAPVPLLPGPSMGSVDQVGEIVVMEGDDEIVTTLDPAGDYGIDIAMQMPLIGQRFYMHFPDEFDGIAVFTTFNDLLQGGAAYSVSAGWSGAGGVGLGGGGSGGGAYGSSGHLISVINMNNVAGYSSMSDSDQWFHTVFGQEFGHTWLAFMTFRDPITGQDSTELLGRDDSHWSAAFNSGGSVMDGMAYTDNGDGTFTATDNSVRYGPIDLYAMGVYAPDEVEDMYFIRNARYMDGRAVGPTDHLGGSLDSGTVVHGERVDITIESLEAAMGPRTPAWNEANEDFRVAFILVTRPGETAGDVADALAKLEVGRLAWENKHMEWTFNRSTMCTDVTAPCPLAIARVNSALVHEDETESDGDGVLEPGEVIRLDISFINPGTVDATSALATLDSEHTGTILPEAETLGIIPAGGTLDHTFRIGVTGEACGEEVTVDILATIEHRAWKTGVTFRPGIIEPDGEESFATDASWVANPGNSDTVISGGWEHGVPNATYFAGRLLQPDGGAGGNLDSAWFTGPTGRWDQGELTGETTLLSAPFDMSQMFRPTVRYKLWYLALDRTQTSLTPSTESHLTVEASSDGGVTWKVIDEVGGEPVRWVTREAELVDVEPSAEVLIRFVARDTETSDKRLVEIGIDDVSIASLSTMCAPGALDGDGDGDGCGCRVPGNGDGRAPGSLWILAALGAVWLGRRGWRS